MSTSLKLTYPAIRKHIASHLAGSRTESEAFLLWFLVNYYRLEETEAYDAVCDGLDDKGIDGIYVDDNLERIDVFQSKLHIGAKSRTLGDVQLKEFVGSLAQLSSPDSVRELAATTANTELRNLINSEEVPTKIEDGYSIRGVFVTNARRDANAVKYIDSQQQLTLFDAIELAANYVAPGPKIPTTTPVTFDVNGFGYVDYRTGGVRSIVAPLKAKELIQLDGLASGALFVWNVRQTLGRTKVNREIGRSIEDPAEHENFLLYHNGLTIVCRKIQRRKSKIAISGYAVVNGCQSLTSLYDNRSKLTDDLRILARLVEVPPESELAGKITHHSNNQNPINARDLQSNSTIQRRLQNEFAEMYGVEIFYRIKRGEQSTLPIVIDNEDAARNLLAFDLHNPWTCHQTYKLFDELYASIFARPEVTATRIVILGELYAAVEDALPKLENELMARYRLTKYFLLFLLRSVLALDEFGQSFCRMPDPLISEENGLARIRVAATRVLEDIIIDLNAELRDREEQDDAIDYKRELKSPKAVRDLEKSVVPQYQKAVSRGRATSFADEWEASKEGTGVSS